MKNFMRLSQGIDTTPLLLAIMRRPELWNQNTLRTKHPGTPHTQVDDIWLRFNELPAAGEEFKIVDEHESVDYPSYAVLPEARILVMNLMHYVKGERLGRVLITKMRPGTRIEPHEDGGSHAAYYDRFHIVLKSAKGNVFRCGDESVYFEPGAIFWFNNAIEHELVNNSDDDRIHMIVDIRTSL